LRLAILAPRAPLALLDPSLKTKADFGGGEYAAIGADSTIYSPSDGKIYDTSLNKTATMTVGGFSITTDALGNAYVADPSGGSLHVVDRNGALLNQFTIPDLYPSLSIDLGPDQCTLYYLDSSQYLVRRYDICADRALSSIPAVHNLDFVRGLRDGGCIVGSASGSALLVYDSRAKLAGVIGVREAGSIESAGAFSSDGQYIFVGIYTGRESAIEKVRLSDGAVVAKTPLGSLQLNSVSVFGEQRPTTDALAAAASIPALSPLLYIALAAALAIIALRRIG